MKFKMKLLKPGGCPVCDKNIYDCDKSGRPLRPSADHATFWVRLNDGSLMEFSCCTACVRQIQPQALEVIMRWQIYTWGMEITAQPQSVFALAAQLKWYIEEAVHLRAEAWSQKKDELPTQHPGPEDAGRDP